jgi:RimJ/RimL family protein N-acetyltransferase
MMHYIKPVAADVEEISSIFRESFNNRWLSKKFSQHLISLYLKHPNLAIVAKDEDKIVGFIYAIDNISRLFKQTKLVDKIAPWRLGYFIPSKLKYANEPFVLIYFVDKDYRGQGIASNLLQKVLDQMKSKQKQVFMQIHLNNKSSIRVAQKHGAQKIEHGGYIKKYGIYRIDL